MTADKPDNIKNNVSNVTDYCVAKGDTGAISHSWMKQDRNVLKTIKKVRNISVQLPNNSTITSSEKVESPLPASFSSKAKSATILPQLRSSNLISLGQLCDDGCNIILNKNK